LDQDVECDNIPAVPVVEATDNCVTAPTICFSEVSNLYDRDCNSFRPLDLRNLLADNFEIVDQAILSSVPNSLTFSSGITANHTSPSTIRPSGTINGDLRVRNDAPNQNTEYRFVFEKPLDLNEMKHGQLAV